MNENKKEIVSDRVAKISEYLLDSVEAGEYDYLLTMDMEEIIRKFNNGNYDVLDSPEIDKFLNSQLYAIKLVEYILRAKDLLEMESAFYNDVAKQKDGMTYNPENIYYSNRSSYRINTLTYAKAEETFKLARRIVNCNKIYALLKFLLKYETMRDSITARKKLLQNIKNNPEGTKQLYAALSQQDSNVGIVRIDSDGDVSVKAGTKQDMVISDLVGKPFSADCDEPGYNYGPYGDYWHDAHKVTKEFYPNGTTPNHQTMIELEKRRRALLRQSPVDVKGFILTEDKAIIISSLELTKLGIDPKSVGWQPLKLTPAPQSVFQVCRDSDSTKYLPLSSKVQLQKNVTLAKRQH